MKTFRSCFVGALFLVGATIYSASAQGTAFTYQGRLAGTNGVLNGLYDLRFTLYDAALNGTAAGSVTNSAVAVTNGLFTATLDFGNSFPGAPRWLEIGVRTNLLGAFTILAPRQPITATPYAITAGGVVAGGLQAGTYASAVTLNNPANSFSGNGSGLTNVNAGTLGGVPVAGFWRLSGNPVLPGQFVGSTNNQPLEFMVYGSRALRLEPGSTNAPNVIGGWVSNTVAPGAVGAVIAGGGGYSVSNGNPYNNRVTDAHGVVSGGLGNLAGDDDGDAANARYATVAGGVLNEARSLLSSIGGGQQNSIQAGSAASTIGGGFVNIIQTNDPSCTIAGGQLNTIQAGSDASTISGGYQNTIQAGAGSSAISGGLQNTIETFAYQSAVGGGFGNVVHSNAAYGVIGGGVQNIVGANANAATIGGGSGNSGTASYATVPGGANNIAAGQYSFAAGYGANALHNGAFVWADSQGSSFQSTGANQFLIRAAGGVGINIDNPGSAALSIGGYLRLNDNNIYLRSSSDFNHGLGWYYGTKSFAGDTTIDGPVLFGFAGGRLATRQSGDHIALSWTPSTVTVNGTFNNNSDRNAKENFKAISTEKVLRRVLQVPVTEWSYKADPATRHIGPMAQDFHATFGVGTDDRHIAPLDEGGVALAAIQGLNEKIELETQKEEHQIATLRQENAELKQQNSALEKRLKVLEQLVLKNDLN